MPSDDPGPGQKYAIAAKGTSLNSAAGDRASRSRSAGAPAAADAKGKRRLTSGPGWRPRSQTPAAWSDPDTRIATGADASLASLKREFSEAKWSDAQAWTKAQLARTKNSKYRPRKKQKPDPTVARVNKRLASRFYQLKTGHCLTES